MKHLLNNLSEEEKNNIREQHEGGMNLAIDNFKKLVETKSGDAKPYLNEQDTDAEEKQTRPFRSDINNLEKCSTIKDWEKAVGGKVVKHEVKGGKGMEALQYAAKSTNTATTLYVEVNGKPFCKVK